MLRQMESGLKQHTDIWNALTELCEELSIISHLAFLILSAPHCLWRSTGGFQNMILWLHDVLYIELSNMGPFGSSGQILIRRLS